MLAAAESQRRQRFDGSGLAGALHCRTRACAVMAAGALAFAGLGRWMVRVAQVHVDEVCRFTGVRACMYAWSWRVVPEVRHAAGRRTAGPTRKSQP